VQAGRKADVINGIPAQMWYSGRSSSSLRHKS